MKKIASLLVVALFLIGTPLPAIGAHMENGVDVIGAGSGLQYISHTPIRINNDTDFANQSSNEGWPGDGSPANPYIIEGYNITGNGAGIYIGNTTAHFIVRNCYVHDVSYVSSPYYWGAGIEIYNVTNGSVESNDIDNSSTGIMFVQSPGNEIYNNTISNSGGYGIYVRDGSDSAYVHGNSISGSNTGGIIIDSSSGGRVYDNTVSSSGSYGIIVHYSPDVSVENNNVSSCSNGIYAAGGPSYLSSPFYVLNNTVSYCDNGIYLDTTPDSTVFNNTISSFTVGIEIYAYSNHTDVKNNTLNGNTVSSTPKGMLLDHVGYVNVSGNLIENIFGYSGGSAGANGDYAYGIYVTTSSVINISHNTIRDIYGGAGAAGTSGSDGNPGGDGGTGGDSYGIYMISSDTYTIEYNRISALYGGAGGDGGRGGDALLQGASGGYGGNGGPGGFAIGIYISSPNEEINNNTLYEIYGGNGGNGGDGGNGADGDGITVPDGNGGDGGAGGEGGDAVGIVISDNGAHVSGNRISAIRSGNGGNGGSGGDSGFLSGFGGAGGNGGWGGDTGTSAYNGASGIYVGVSQSSVISNNYMNTISPGTPGQGGGYGTGTGGDGTSGGDGGTVISGSIMVSGGTGTEIYENEISDSPQYSVYIVGGSSSSNLVYHNNFINITMGAFDSASGERWDNGYPCGGNYWSDYNGTDNKSGPNQDVYGSDGIGDTEYSVGTDSNGAPIVDRYPLMSPWGHGVHVISTTPSDGETNALIDADVIVVFNTSMDTSHTPQIGQTLGTPVNYTFAGWGTTYVANDTATWTHDTWKDEENVGLRVSDFVNLNGDYGTPYCWSFKTQDITPPSVISTTPSDGSAGIGTGFEVKVVFDESLNTSIIPSLTELSSSGASYTFNRWESTNVANDTAVWTHSTWPEKTDITLRVTGAEDISGNVMSANYDWTFTTGDFTSPTVISTIPADGEAGVNRSITIVVVFSEEMDTSYNGGAPSLWFRNGTNPGGWVGLGWSSTNVNNDTYSWAHNNFTENDRISLAVADYADIAGNVGSTYEWSFYIEDVTAPYVNSTVPANGATDVYENHAVSVVFSETMNTSVIPILTQISGTLVNYSFAGWDTTYVKNDTATWTHDLWADKDSITLMVSNYSDLAGHMGQNYTWSFTVRDYVDPTVVSTDPADGELWVPLDRVVTVVFSESLNSSVIPTITQTAGNSVNYTFIGWSSTNYPNDTAMWSHDNWSQDEQISIKISGYEDLSGRLGSDYYFSFKSADLTPPSVLSTDPYDEQKQVPYDHNITVIFNDTMDTSTVPVLTQTTGDSVVYTFLGWSTTYVTDDTATWSHDNWTDSDTISLTVSGYYDEAGNTGQNYSWSFRVYDTTPPTITSSSPYDGEINVSVSITHVYVNFSEPMDPNANNPQLYIDADGNKPQSSFWKWIDAERTGVIFNITGQFSESDHVHMWLSTIQDPYNNNLVNASWWFYTYDPVPPGVNDTNPWDGERPPDIVKRNQTVIVYFDTSLEYLNTSVIPIITQKDGDPGGWTFLGWDEDIANRAMASWSHNNWTTETVNLTVSHYRDMCGNWGKPYSWEFSVQLYEAHDMIRINSDAEFANMAASEGWIGDGSPSNPYIIEYYNITGDVGRGGYCIYIGNTTVSFIIRHNSLNYAYTDNPVYPYYPKASVALYNVKTGKVENNTMDVQSDFAVYVYESQNINISGNQIQNAWWNGMNIYNSSYISIWNNQILGGGNGLYLKNSPYARIYYNRLSQDGNQNGITLENSSYALVLGNMVEDYNYGIVFDPDGGTDVNITLKDNHMKNCGLMIWGWLYEHWASHIIVNNTVNNRPLVFLNGMDDFQINYTIHAGQIYLVDCYNVSVSNQFIVRATVGLYVAVSQMVTIVNSTFAYNNYGIYMTGSQGNTIWHNNFVGNDIQAHDDASAGENLWNATYPNGGNYWDDYTGSDNYLGPGQNIPGSDGIGDSSYAIDGGGSVDNYPLMKATPLTIYYTPGWHMVAFPWLITPTDISTALANTSWDRAMIYLNDTWHTYDNTRPARYNIGFPLIDRSMGLWVHFTDNSTLVGDSPIHTGNITVYVHKGWNLVEGGLPFLVDEVFANVEYSYVQSANLTNPSQMEDIGANETMISGRAYWVYVDNDYTIIIDTDNFTITTMQGIVPTVKGDQNIVLVKGTDSTGLATDTSSPDLHSSSKPMRQISMIFALPLLIILVVCGIVWSTGRKRED